MNTLQLTTKYLAIFAFLIFPQAHAVGGEDWDRLVTEAEKYFSHFPIAQMAYDEATKFKKGEGKFPALSLSSIVYASVGYNMSRKLAGGNSELLFKSLYNLALLEMAAGNITTGYHLLKLAAKQGFGPSARTFAIVEAAFLKWHMDVVKPLAVLDPDERSRYPYGRIHRNFEEEIYDTLVEQGIPRIQLTKEEQGYFGLADRELEGLSNLAEMVERYVEQIEDPCVLLVGRSPLLLGMMLKARSKLNAPVVRTPFSGLKEVDLCERLGGEVDGAYLAFLKAHLPKATNYIVVDLCDSGCTLRYFLDYLKTLGVESNHLHCIPIGIGDSQFHDLPANTLILEIDEHARNRMSVKSLFHRALIMPGISFFPRHWMDAARQNRVIEFEGVEEIERPAIRYQREQMEEFVRMRGIATRELFADPQIQAPERDILEMGRVIAADITGISHTL